MKVDYNHSTTGAIGSIAKSAADIVSSGGEPPRGAAQIFGGTLIIFVVVAFRLSLASISVYFISFQLNLFLNHFNWVLIPFTDFEGWKLTQGTLIPSTSSWIRCVKDGSWLTHFHDKLFVLLLIVQLARNPASIASAAFSMALGILLIANPLLNVIFNQRSLGDAISATAGVLCIIASIFLRKNMATALLEPNAEAGFNSLTGSGVFDQPPGKRG